MNFLKFLAFLLLTVLALSGLTSCAPYESSVGSRSVGVAGGTSGEDLSGKLIYTVTYR